jgi:hypothetical protein
MTISSRAEKGWTAKLKNRTGNRQASFLKKFAAAMAEQRRKRKNVGAQHAAPLWRKTLPDQRLSKLLFLPSP